jgi:cysteine synthase A
MMSGLVNYQSLISVNRLFMYNILDAIGNTPLIKIENHIFAKLETTNPSGSVKDRMAKYLIEKGEKSGKLKPGYTIIEATSGNTGVSFAMIAAAKGYKFVAVMPKKTSEGKKRLMKLFGAQFILTPDEQGLGGAIKKAEELAKKEKKVWLPRQFENPDNVKSQEKGLGQEILKQVKKIDAFVAGIGTGGTLMGVAYALKKKHPRVKIIGVEAAETHHQIEGISDGIVPKILDPLLIDEIIKIKSREAVSMAKKLAKNKGLLVGISSGANVLAAMKISKQLGQNKHIVTVLPDRAERYLEHW